MKYQPPKPKPSDTPSNKKEEERKKLVKEKDKKKKLAADIAREALGLKRKEQHPEAILSAEMKKAISTLPYEDQVQVETVLGCSQEMVRRIEASQKKIEQEAGVSTQLSRNVSFSQQLMVRRAERGELDADDIERSRGIIQNQAAKGAMDPIQTGSHALFQQSQKMLRANQMLLTQLGNNNSPEHALIIQTIQRGAGDISRTMANYQARFNNTGIETLKAAVLHKDTIRQEAIVKGVSPT